MSFRDCTEITPSCPLEATIYAYRPNIGGNSFFLAGFSICLIAQIYLGIRHKTWSWLGCLFVGCAMELIGYIGRLMMNNNPWSDTAFRIQIVCLILGSSLMSGSIDLVLKHVVLTFGSEFSRIPAKWYTWVFIGADITSIVVQAIGGALASSGDATTIEIGNNMMLAGIILQVVQLVAFGIVTLEYGVRSYRHCSELVSYRTKGAESLWKFKLFAWSCTIAYFAILVRCCYRIPELAQGWGGPLMQDEVTFLVLDGAMILFAAIVLTVFHPGIFFPQMASNSKERRERKDLEKSSDRSPSPVILGEQGVVATGA
ncbi:RTA1-domain-containing protein [Cadophora sp. DSE1049]|nr:RTA1-domain-containing protein [Cadophora sp. DSE1049]